SELEKRREQRHLRTSRCFCPAAGSAAGSADAPARGSAFAPAGILPDAGQIWMAVEEFRCGRGETHFAVRETWSVGLLVMRPLRQNQRRQSEDQGLHTTPILT